MPQSMSWHDLLNTDRYHPELETPDANKHTISPTDRFDLRSPFEKDCDRIIFSDAFRRLGRKTQVHPVSKNDHVHTRLTHSQEVAAVGRSLANRVFVTLDAISRNTDNLNLSKKTREHIAKDFHHLSRMQSPLATRIDAQNIVQAACLAHDIGNTPFGHAGENAIQHWAMDNYHFLQKLNHDQHINDLLHFDGNAKGFRQVTQIEKHRNQGGLRLTNATLGAMMKYPWSSMNAKANNSKFGFFATENPVITNVAKQLKLLQSDDLHFARHPLSFLMEAADDICYAVIDIEDAIELEILNAEDIEHVLVEISVELKNFSTKSEHSYALRSEIINNLDEMITSFKSHGNKVNYNNKSNQTSLRNCMMNCRCRIMDWVIADISLQFVNHYNLIMSGNFKGDLIAPTIDSEESAITKIIIHRLKALAIEKIFIQPRKVELEIGCYSTIKTLLDSFFQSIEQVSSTNHGEYPFIDEIQHPILNLISPQANITPNDTIYNAYIKVLDFVSGMTDDYATQLASRTKLLLNGTPIICGGQFRPPHNHTSTMS